jgi:hypothetical protein
LFGNQTALIAADFDNRHLVNVHLDGTFAGVPASAGNLGSHSA